MAEIARFFDSVAGDRVYSSDAWADIFGAVHSNGVLLGGLKVDPAIPVSMDVSVAPGAAFIQGRFYASDDDIPLEVPPADASLDRIDRVVVRLDYTDRTITTVYKDGTPAASPVAPALQQDASRFEISLAKITVDAGQVSVVAGDITDERHASGPVAAARGQLGYAEITTDSATFGGTITDIAGLSVTVDVQANRRVRITGWITGFSGLDDPGQANLYVREASTVLVVAPSEASPVPDYQTSDVQVQRVFTPTTGAHTYKVSANAFASTARVRASTTFRAFILVEDIGPA